MIAAATTCRCRSPIPRKGSLVLGDVVQAQQLKIRFCGCLAMMPRRQFHHLPRDTRIAVNIAMGKATQKNVAGRTATEDPFLWLPRDDAGTAISPPSPRQRRADP